MTQKKKRERTRIWTCENKRKGKKEGTNKGGIQKERNAEHKSIGAAIGIWAQASLREFLEAIC